MLYELNIQLWVSLWSSWLGSELPLINVSLWRRSQRLAPQVHLFLLEKVFLASSTSAAVNSWDLSFSLTFAQMLKGPGCLPSSMMEDEDSGSVAAAESSTYEFSPVSLHIHKARGWNPSLCDETMICRAPLWLQRGSRGANLHVNARGNDSAATARQRAPSLPADVFAVMPQNTPDCSNTSTHTHTQNAFTF